SLEEPGSWDAPASGDNRNGFATSKGPIPAKIQASQSQIRPEGVIPPAPHVIACLLLTANRSRLPSPSVSPGDPSVSPEDPSVSPG
ncbi:MAG: hypothetical protein ACK49R_09080, partial [Planctomycetota bacterium]